MAIESIHEIWNDREATVDGSGNRKYTRSYRVITSDNLRDGIECLYYGDLEGRAIPRMWTPYIIYDNSGTPITYDGQATVREITPRNFADDPRTWTVTVQYSSESPPVRAERPNENISAGGGPGGVAKPNTGGPSVGASGAPSNPQPDPPTFPKLEIEWTFAQFQKAALRDLDGNLVANSAGQQFDPPIMIDDSRPTVRISRNEMLFNPATAIAYQDAVNSDSFFGAAPRQAKLVIGPITFQYENNVQFWRVTYTIQFRRDGWRLRLLDAGYMQRVSGQLVNILDSNGQPVSSPHPLDSHGLKGDPADPKYLEYRVYNELPFSPLGLSPF